MRELENAIERAAILADGPLLEPQHLSLSAPTPPRTTWTPSPAPWAWRESWTHLRRARQMVERLMIKRALAEAGSRCTPARLEVNYKRLLARVRELGLEDSLV